MRADEQHLIGKCQNMLHIFTFRSIWQTWCGFGLGVANCWLGKLSPDKHVFCSLKVLSIPCHSAQWQLPLCLCCDNIWNVSWNIPRQGRENMNQSYNPGQARLGHTRPVDRADVPWFQSVYFQILWGNSIDFLTHTCTHVLFQLWRHGSKHQTAEIQLQSCDKAFNQSTG